MHHVALRLGTDPGVDAGFDFKETVHFTGLGTRGSEVVGVAGSVDGGDHQGRHQHHSHLQMHRVECVERGG